MYPAELCSPCVDKLTTVQHYTEPCSLTLYAQTRTWLTTITSVGGCLCGLQASWRSCCCPEQCRSLLTFQFGHFTCHLSSCYQHKDVTISWPAPAPSSAKRREFLRALNLNRILHGINYSKKTAELCYLTTDHYQLPAVIFRYLDM